MGRVYGKDMRIFHDMTFIGKTLLFGGAVLFVALITFSNAGLLPPGIRDFLFFLLLAVLAALYRPGWMFLLLLLSLPLETVNLAPSSLGAALRPYQFLELSLLLGLLIRFLSGRTLPEPPKFGLQDAMLLLVPLGSILALVNAPSAAPSSKLSLVLLSLYGLYLLSRTYLRSMDDIRRILPFVLVSGFLVLSYAILQNVRFLLGLGSFEIMPGRPDGGFPEPDWLGMYLVFFGSTFLAIFSGMVRRRSVGDFKARPWELLAETVSLAAVFMVLLMTVSRSAWLGMAVSGIVATGLFAYAQRDVRAMAMYVGGIFAAFLLALFLVVSVPMTRFDLSGRAMSTTGWQEITVSCDAGSVRSAELPERISDVSELASYDCRHIDLEEAEAEEAAGNIVGTIDRPDPNVEIRKDIYGVSLGKAAEYPFLGIGWGSIGGYLGMDGRGAALNASNVFLEVWLGSGFFGLVGFVGFLLLAFIRAVRLFFRSHPETGSPSDVFPMFIFVISVIPGLLVFDLFNSGILLGFLWVLFGALFVSEKKSENR